MEPFLLDNIHILMSENLFGEVSQMIDSQEPGWSDLMEVCSLCCELSVLPCCPSTVVLGGNAGLQEDWKLLTASAASFG